MFNLRMALMVLLASALSFGAADAFAQGGHEKHASQDPAPAAKLSDPEIAHIAVTANAIDVDLAKLAQSRATDPKVRRFAQTMIDDHTAVNERAAALAKRLGVTPLDNAVSQTLWSDAKTARAKLEKLSGVEFDRAYMEREVAYHQAVLDAIDQTLIPGATNAELRSLLQEVRPAIGAHLKVAQSMVAGSGDSR